MERPRGDRVLADSGARRDLSQSLAEGLAQLVAELGRRLPDVESLIQLDEPMLPRCSAGTIATASGLAAASRRRAARGFRPPSSTSSSGCRQHRLWCTAVPPAAHRTAPHCGRLGRARRYRSAVQRGLGRRRCQSRSRSLDRHGRTAHRRLLAGRISSLAAYSSRSAILASSLRSRRAS